MEVTLEFRITFAVANPPEGITVEDVAECVQAGFITFRDNSLEIASVEDFETGKQHAITIEDFTMEYVK